jgi:HK97 family phage major capsid protein
MKHITDAQALSARKLAAPAVRKLGVKDIRDFEPHKLSWSDLNARQKDLVLAARSLTDSMAGKSEDEAAEIEAAYDAIMAAHDECEGEKDIRSRIGNREARAAGGDPRRPGMTDGEAQPAGYRGSEPEVAYALRPEQRMADLQRGRAGVEGYNGLTLGRYFRSMVVGAESDVERRALTEGTDSAGGYTVPTPLSDELIDLMRAATVAIRAGARTVPLTSDTNYVAKVASDPVPAWRAEGGLVAEGDPTFSRVTFAPKSLAVIVRASRELIEDSLNIATMLPQIIAAAMAQELDRVAFFGSGTGNEPRGLTKTAGISTVAAGGALTGYGRLIQARTAVLSANAPGITSYVLHPRDEGKLAGLVDGQGQPLNMPPAIAQVPMLTTTAVPTNGGVGVNESSIVTGHFPHLLIGIRSAIRVEVLRERFADTLQYGFLAHMRADIAVEQPGSFCTITGITP